MMTAEPESLAEVWDNLPDLLLPSLRQGTRCCWRDRAGKAAVERARHCRGQGPIGDAVPGAGSNVNPSRPGDCHRFRASAALAGPAHKNIDIWNLRGKAAPMDKLAPKLIRRAAKKGFSAVIIDPIYKVITGDENSADQMAHFANQFDKICTELGTAVIYCHHHSKGYQGQKRSMDRASGSGVFARDPDALLDLTELELTRALKKQITDRRVRLHRCHPAAGP